MEPKIVRHGIKHILADTDIGLADCPDCDFISITTSDSLLEKEYLTFINTFPN